MTNLDMHNVLVVEDDDMIRGLVVDILREEGFSTFEACHGAQALEVAQTQSLDLVLCDVMMPHVDGFTVLDELRSRPHLQSIPFIFLTAKAERQALRYGMEHGADDYITKPFSRSELLKAVETQLQKAAAARPSTSLCNRRGTYISLQSQADVALTLQQMAMHLQSQRETLTPDEIGAIAAQLQTLAQQLRSPIPDA
jgi:DNA-binding response OmpR family regulator